MSTDKIKVAVRVRPFNRRELELDTQCVVKMEKQQTLLQAPPSLDKMDRKQPKSFAFDHCFCSVDPAGEGFASQEVVFDSLGRDILDNAFQGYNACIFAYGQTGSGKSYTMMGSQDNKGIIPRLCDSLFGLIAKQQSSELTYKVEVSYMEIYNEKVHDLLDPQTNKQSLKVREHNVLGPYVDGLSQLAVTSFMDIDNLMAEGNKSRTVAATNMNSESSRSHAVFTVILTQTLVDTKSGVTGEKVSRMSLVDLAGSERAVKTGAVGDRLKEGSNINNYEQMLKIVEQFNYENDLIGEQILAGKDQFLLSINIRTHPESFRSLTTLGLVISKLADQSSGSKNKDKFVPYRDSVLTWILKDNLGGNSKTVMVATVSPAADNYEETLSTLRYADRAKRIVNHAVVNEDPNARIIRELRQEVEALKEMLKHATGSPVGDTQRVDIHQKLSESEKLYKEVSQTWEEKLMKTERIQNERQQALEKMGISIQASGIKVEKNKYYLVNLNADPSLNELLVYYLKDRTIVGAKSFDCGVEPDIQLSGLGIQAEHCIITIEDGELFLEPLSNARSYINGSQKTNIWYIHQGFATWDQIPSSVKQKTDGVAEDLIYSATSEPQTPAQNIDYNFARDELMLNELINDPIQAAISRLEKQHKEDKQVALEKQRMEYERQFQQLRNIMSPSTPYPPYSCDPLRASFGKITPCTPTTQMRVEKWAQERDEMFKRSIGQLKAGILQANSLVQEANCLAEHTGRQTKFSVTLQIPPDNLSPNRRKGAFVSEPAILVKRGNQSQVWSMEKLENKIIDMRELYEEKKEHEDYIKDSPVKGPDPFFESQENHNLIGVANIFLEALFHDIKLDYHTPIISQQGEVAGRLQIELSRVGGSFPQDRICEAASDNSSESSHDDEEQGSSSVTCRVHIKQASGLPLSLSHYVFCQYTFWNYPDPIVVPTKTPDIPTGLNISGAKDSTSFKFEHMNDFHVPMTEEFLEHCSEGALSIEVWGNRSAGFSKHKPGWEVEQQLATARSLVDRWSELTRKIELWVEIQELNDQGEYAPVEVATKNENACGGVYQLRQGQQRRIQVRVKPVQNSGTLPIICQQIVKIEVGGVMVRSRLQKHLDSYQEEDLAVLREKWSDALQRRHQYLEQQIKKLLVKTNKTDQDVEREQSLMDQWVNLTEERNAVFIPTPGSEIPGAPALWSIPPGMESFIPVLFLDLNADDLTTHPSGAEVTIAGANSILSKEVGSTFYSLHILHHLEKDVCAVASWDSSIHESSHLNKITEPIERVYMILRITVRLSHPAPMDLVLRKRLALNIYKRQSITDRIKRRIVRSDLITHCGVTYVVVSNVPKASEELEDRESLAQLVASGEDSSLCDGETYIEKYTRGVSAVESILTLDRLRQSVAVKELLQAKGQPLMRKTASVPNFSQLMRLDMSTESLHMSRSESVSELTSEMHGVSASLRPRSSFGKDTEVTPTKPFGLARPTFLNLSLNLNSLRLQQPNGATKLFSGITSPANSKLGLRMTTLHEEQPVLPRKHSLDLLSADTIEEQCEDGQDDKPEVTHTFKTRGNSRRTIPTSRTLDSLVELAPKSGTPSTTSSGYGSQAVSTTNLSSDDSIMSLRSISVDETPDVEHKSTLTTDLTSVSESIYSEDQGSSNNEDNSEDSTMNGGDNNSDTSQDKLTDKESASIIKTNLSLGRVVRRKKTSKMQHAHRASFPQARPPLSDSKHAHNLEQNLIKGNLLYTDESLDSSTDRLEDDSENTFGSKPDLSKLSDVPVPEWVVLGESVLIRPYNSSGVVAYIGGTEFASGTWIGVELDAPKGKNDGMVQGVRYFNCRPKYGMFVRADKLILDRRGRAMRAYKADSLANKCGKGDGLPRSRSRGDGLNSVGTSRPSSKAK